MLASFIAAGVGVFLPWLAGKHRRLTGFLCAVFAVFMYYAYEFVLDHRARPGDPLIRVELFLLYPLLITALASCIAAVVLPRMRRQSTDTAGAWQYSTAGLLIVMTLVAIFFGMLAVLTQNADVPK